MFRVGVKNFPNKFRPWKKTFQVHVAVVVAVADVAVADVVVVVVVVVRHNNLN